MCQIGAWAGEGWNTHIILIPRPSVFYLTLLGLLLPTCCHYPPSGHSPVYPDSCDSLLLCFLCLKSYVCPFCSLKSKPEWSFLAYTLNKVTLHLKTLKWCSINSRSKVLYLDLESPQWPAPFLLLHLYFLPLSTPTFCTRYTECLSVSVIFYNHWIFSHGIFFLPRWVTLLSLI